MSKVYCPDCNGNKTKYMHFLHRDRSQSGWRWVDCHKCGGTGEVEPAAWLAVAWGNALRVDERARFTTSLQEYQTLGVDAVELSKCHMGDASPEVVGRIQAARDRAGLPLIPFPYAEPVGGVIVIVARSGDSVWQTEPVRYPRLLAEARVAEHTRCKRPAKIVEPAE